MVRPKRFYKKAPLMTNVTPEFREHMNSIARRISKESGKVITVSELIRCCLEKFFPMVTYKDLDHKERFPEEPRQMEFIGSCSSRNGSDLEG